MASVQILPVTAGDDLEGVGILLTEYLCLPLEGTSRKVAWNVEDLDPSVRNELANLPGDYQPPGGRLTLATQNGRPVGCAAALLDLPTAELKRLYVRPEARKLGIGGRLVVDAANWARAVGCSELRVDVWPGREHAIQLYRSLGFGSIAPFRSYPFEMVFLSLPLGE